MSSRAQAGLVQLAIAGIVLAAWWTGAWGAIVGQLTSGILTPPAAR